jgi:hypothetical protein
MGMVLGSYSLSPISKHHYVIIRRSMGEINSKDRKKQGENARRKNF